MSECRVKHMAIAKDDASLWGVRDMLQEASVCVENSEYRNKKAIVIFLDDEDGLYDVGWLLCGLKQSEVISLCEIMKTLAKETMGYVNKDERPT